MAPKKVTVELVPWTHVVTFLAHEDVVHHIKSLPKNSSIMLEINSRELNKLSRFIEKPDPMVHLNDPKWAALEILLACGKRNIKVIPLDTLISVASLGLFRVIASGRHTLTTQSKREDSMVRQIRPVLENFKGKKLPVVVGAGHVMELKRKLGNLGITATVNTELFTEAKKIKESMRLDKLVKEATIAGDEEKATKLAYRVRDLVTTKRSTDYKELISNEIWSRLHKKEERVKRRLSTRQKRKPPKRK